MFIDRLNTKSWKEPIGFNHKIDWEKNKACLNNCLRINKYEKDDKFYWHKDAPYTSSHTLKSNYTIVIYLNDEAIGGETTFRIPSHDIIHNVLTIKEELEQITEYKDLTIKPQMGMAVVFDHSLLHMSSPITAGTKYVLRTDLLCQGNKTDYDEPPLFKQIENLAISLFRQAQYFELNNDDRCSELYERCISLRQSPHLIDKYPDELEKYLVDIKVNENINHVLQCVSRSGRIFSFQINNNSKNSVINYINMVKTCALYILLTEIKTIEGEKFNFQKHVDLMLKNITINSNNKFDDKYYDTQNLNEELNININANNDSDSDSDSNSDSDSDSNSDSDTKSNNSNKDEEIVKRQLLKKLNNHVLEINEGMDDYDFKQIKNSNHDLFKHYMDNESKKSINKMITDNKVEYNTSLSFKITYTPINISGCHCNMDGPGEREYNIYSISNAELNKNNLIFMPNNIKIKNNIMTGELKTEVLCTPFNHASCQCEFFVKNIHEPKTKYYTVKPFFRFRITKGLKLITIQYIPHIIM